MNKPNAQHRQLGRGIYRPKVEQDRRREVEEAEAEHDVADYARDAAIEERIDRRRHEQ